jgi:hypothetical protein
VLRQVPAQLTLRAWVERRRHSARTRKQLLQKKKMARTQIRAKVQWRFNGGFYGNAVFRECFVTITIHCCLQENAKL